MPLTQIHPSAFKLVHVLEDEVPLMSPTELAPLSSWLEKVRLESRLRSEECPPSDVLIDLELELEAAGEKERGCK